MKTAINIKIDKSVKEEAKKTANELGLSLSAVINAYLRQLIKNKEISFSVAPQMSIELEKLLDTIEYDIKRDKNFSKVLTSDKDIDKHLNS